MQTTVASPTFAPHAFKAYDIRGVVPDVIDERFAFALGVAFGQRARALGEAVVAVGRDGRLSSPMLAAALIDGLASAGVDVLDVGMVTTPMLYYAAATHCRSGIQVTGSHNPKQHNGFKMVLAGRAIYGDEIQALRLAMEATQGAAAAQTQRGRVQTLDILPEYIARVVGDVRLARPLKLVIDCGNGVTGASAPALFRALGCDVTVLYGEVDGEFPHHHPDPSKPENLRDLIAALQRTGADLGFAFDGDGDRLGVVTPSGQNIFPDRQLMLLAADVLTRVPGGTIVYDVKCSQRLAPAIRAAGGVPLMYRTGHSLVKAKMREVGAPLGGEMSGHLFFQERWYGFDDGSYAGARLLEILSRHDDPGAVLEALPSSYATPELNVACAEGEPHRVVAELQRVARFDPPAEVSTVDGLRVDWPDGFGLIRASNTTPVLVLRFEGHTPEALARIEAELLALLRRVKPDAVVAQGGH
ncbi:phosphomannomutase/phosphoglucomutase [Tepidimonas sp.]|uniref:phosphomannomutase/phosphoglucomutase n=1 Tax=Tepidimonas sp. TaxID=2002775 RepID=UPI002FE0E01D